jgi:peroxiredoxin Q/BCP
VLKEKTMYGKKVFGIERSTFVIDEQGRIARSFRGVKVAGHARAVLESLPGV